MMRRKRAELLKGSLKGWWWYLPFVLIPIGTFMAETFLRTGIISNEYEAWDLKSEMRDLRESIHELEGDLTEKTNMETITRQSGDLGLVPPVPGQVHILRVTEDMPGGTSYEVAGGAPEQSLESEEGVD